MNVIGIGQAGCAIAEKFKQYPQYKVFKIDTGLKGKNCFNMPKQNHPEKYEAKCPVVKVRTFLKGVRKKVLFITSCGNISGANLRVLEHLKANRCKITVLYIKPELELLSELQALQENVSCGVLQEYARSAVFERMYIISNSSMSKVIGNVPVREYYEKINQAIAYTFHMVSVFKNTNSIMDTFSAQIPSTRLSTLGIADAGTGEEKMFFSLDKARDKRYYYAVPEEVLNEDGTLLNEIKNQVKQKIIPDEAKAMYGIYTTQYSGSFVFCEAHASMVQKNEKII